MARQLAESEDRRRLVLESAELGSWHVDPSTMSLTTDERFRAIFGVTADHIDYEQAVALIHPDDQGHVRAAVDAATHPDNPAALCRGVPGRPRGRVGPVGVRQGAGERRRQQFAASDHQLRRNARRHHGA